MKTTACKRYRPTKSKFRLLTSAQLNKLPSLKSLANERDPVVHHRLFCPSASHDIYVMGGSPYGEDFVMLVKVNDDVGHQGLAEIEHARGPFGLGFERDRHFRPCRLSKLG